MRPRIWHIDRLVYDLLPEVSRRAVEQLADAVGGPGSFADCRELVAVGASVYGWYYRNDDEGHRYLEPGTDFAAYRVERKDLAAL